MTDERDQRVNQFVMEGQQREIERLRAALIQIRAVCDRLANADSQFIFYGTQPLDKDGLLEDVS